MMHPIGTQLLITIGPSNMVGMQVKAISDDAGQLPIGKVMVRGGQPVAVPAIPAPWIEFAQRQGPAQLVLEAGGREHFAWPCRWMRPAPSSIPATVDTSGLQAALEFLYHLRRQAAPPLFDRGRGLEGVLVDCLSDAHAWLEVEARMIVATRTTQATTPAPDASKRPATQQHTILRAILAYLATRSMADDEEAAALLSWARVAGWETNDA